MKILTIAPRGVGKTSCFASMYATLQEKQTLLDGTQNIWFESDEKTSKNLEGIFTNYIAKGKPVPGTNRLTDFNLILKQRQDKNVIDLVKIEWTDTVGEETNYDLNNSILFNQILKADACFIFYDGIIIKNLLKEILKDGQELNILKKSIEEKKLFECAQTLAEQYSYHKWKKGLAIVITKVDLLENYELEKLTNVLYLLEDWFRDTKCDYKICLSSVVRSIELEHKIENFYSLRLLEWLVRLEHLYRPQYQLWQRGFVYLKAMILKGKVLATSSLVFVAIFSSLFLVSQWNKSKLQTPTIESNFEKNF